MPRTYRIGSIVFRPGIFGKRHDFAIFIKNDLLSGYWMIIFFVAGLTFVSVVSILLVRCLDKSALYRFFRRIPGTRRPKERAMRDAADHKLVVFQDKTIRRLLRK